ncbi:hypothetical protein COL154_013889, partial [Colletotrichum chrysophilum]
SEGIVPIDQFKGEDGELEVSVGDEVKVALDAIENGFGETMLSREKAKRSMVWDELEGAFEQEEAVTGRINGKVKGGFTVDIRDVRAFLPGSLVDVRPVRDPSYLEGKDLEFKIIKLDRRRNNLGVSRRAVVESEYSEEREKLLERLTEGAIVHGVVKNLTDYGAFVELEPGVEGLVHVSEMDWTNKNVNPAKVVQVGDEVEVMVLDVDEERRRISLGMKQTQSNPWEAFAATYKKGDKVHGAIKSITDFGIFVGLDGGIDGLVHLSDISWQGTGEELVREFKKGEEVDAVVLAVDPERERISLGIKQLEQDPFGQFMAAHPRGAILTGTVKEVDAKGAVIDLAEGIEGYLSTRDFSKDRIDDLSQHLKVGEQVEAKFIGMDRKGRMLQLSIRAKDEDEMAETLSEYQSQNAGKATTKLGALLKEQLNKPE